MASVSVARLSWLENEFLAGRSAMVRISYNPVTFTEKVSFVLGPIVSALPRRVCVLSAIAALRVSLMEGHIVTDKGHTHKGVGSSVVEFWVRSRPPIPSPTSSVAAQEPVVNASASVELPATPVPVVLPSNVVAAQVPVVDASASLELPATSFPGSALRSFRVTPGDPVVIRAGVRSSRVIGELQPGAVVRGRVRDGCLHLSAGGVLKVKYVELLHDPG